MKKLLLATAISSLSIALPSAVMAKDFNLGQGWKADIGIQVQAFLVDNNSSVDAEVDTGISSGFDPSKLTVTVVAPEQNGYTVSGTIQATQNNNGPGTATNGGNNDEFRVAEFAVSGDFGTIKAGRGWQIMGSSSLLHDSGSLPGVGGQCVGTGSSLGDFGGSCGRIGYGYVWTYFDVGVQYASPDFNGLSFRVGTFNSPSDSPRIEGEVNYKSSAFDLWASFSDDESATGEDISAFDVGAEVRFSGFALTAAYTDSTGITNGLRGANPGVDAEYFFVEADYTVGGTTFGVSYGENEVDGVSESGSEASELTMAFVHYKLTDAITLVAEFNNEEVVGGNDTNRFVVGGQLNF